MISQISYTLLLHALCSYQLGGWPQQILYKLLYVVSWYFLLSSYVSVAHTIYQPIILPCYKKSAVLCIPVIWTAVYITHYGIYTHTLLTSAPSDPKITVYPDDWRWDVITLKNIKFKKSPQPLCTLNFIGLLVFNTHVHRGLDVDNDVDNTTVLALCYILQWQGNEHRLYFRILLERLCSLGWTNWNFRILYYTCTIPTSISFGPIYLTLCVPIKLI